MGDVAEFTGRVDLHGWPLQLSTDTVVKGAASGITAMATALRPPSTHHTMSPQSANDE